MSPTTSQIRTWSFQTNYMADAAFLTHEIPSNPIPNMSKAEDPAEWPLATPHQGSGDPFMVENEDLKSQRATQNPWRTLAKFRNPLKKGYVGLGARFPLLSLPVELLLVIVAHLPIESAACLALACKTTYLNLGTTFFKMSKPDLWKFLLLIEHERPNSFACSLCLTLHRPPESLTYSRYRCCRNGSLISRFSVGLVLPETITPGLVKMIGRKWLEDPKAFQEYLSWVIMREKKTTRYIKLSTHVIPRMLDGSLVLRTETYIHAFVDGHLTERSLIELAAHVGEGEYFPTSRDVPSLCHHEKWESHLTNLTTLKKSVKPTKCASEDEDDEGHHFHMTRCYSNERVMRKEHGHEYPIEMCDIMHKQPCRSWKVQTPSSRTRTPEDKEARKASRPKLEDTYDGEIMGCKKCITDFCISACEVPGLGYCLVLTTWKDLGGVGPGFSEKWNHHITDLPSRYLSGDLDDVRSEDQVGQAYEAYEKLDRSYLGTPQRYRPEPDRKMIRDLTRRVHKPAYKIDNDETTDTDDDTEVEEDDGDL